MQLVESLLDSFEKIIEPMGYSVVRVQINGLKRKALQVMIEKLDGTPINIDDCATVSRTLSVHLNVNDPIAGEYNLEISSTGPERPLVRLSDYKRFQGKEIMLRTILPVENRKNFHGFLENVSEDSIFIHLKHPLDSGLDKIEIRYGEIRQAHLVNSVN